MKSGDLYGWGYAGYGELLGTPDDVHYASKLDLGDRMYVSGGISLQYMLHNTVVIKSQKHISTISMREASVKQRLASLQLNLYYRQFSNIRRTQSLYINVSVLVLQLPLPIILKPAVKLITKM